ncbi:MAG: tetratricopeptide repeat protein [Candidatus Sericytochromatia bacterium]|nr:tetratricopeptide repeat protein [Candidatus Sericytochromatia bacterium]
MPMPDRALQLLEQAWGLQQAAELTHADRFYAEALDFELPLEPKQFALQQRGLIALLQKDLPRAKEQLEAALALGASADLLNLWGSLLRDQGELELARQAFEQALVLAPLSAVIHHNLGNLFCRFEDWAEALLHLLKACEIQPESGYFETRFFQLLKQLLYSDKCMWLYQWIFSGPLQTHNSPLLAFVRGSLHRRLGEPEKALPFHQMALQARPDDGDFYTGYQSLFLFLPDLSDQERFEPFRQWGQTQEAAVQPMTPALNRQDPQRRLRVGYVSGDLNLHSLSCLLLGLFQAHQTRDFFWVIYANSWQEDEFTRRFQQAVQLWRNCADLSDQALAEQIQADQIDILVDLSGHTLGHRLQVFARKPAPIQISGLGFGWTSGLSRMDYLFSDAWIVPPEREDCYSEALLTLSHLFHWTPPYTLVGLPLQDLPCLDSDQIVLGSGNEGLKLNETLIETWAEILKQLPQAQLALKFRGLEDPHQREHLQSRFARMGIGPERLILQGKTAHQEHVAWYGSLDLALDPFPYNGGVSTLETLWMGVPVISLAAGTRAGVSLLNTLGHPELLAQSQSEYIAKALALAQDPLRLVAYRQTLRQTLLASPICDSRAYAREIENAYRHVWQRWCDQIKA